MIKHNLLIKKFKKQILSINDLIESNFNKFNHLKSNYKKFKLSRNNRVFLTCATVILLSLCYFLIPTLFDKNVIQAKIKNQILKKYNIDIKFNEEIYYGLLPKPHFASKNLSIFNDKKEIAISKNFKIFIPIIEFFNFDSVVVKDFIFSKTDFNINIDDLNFFEKFLNTEANENKIQIRDSNIFFKNKNGEVLFINKIFNSSFYYDFNNLVNSLSSKNEIFNVPYKLSISTDRFNKKVYGNFNSKKIRLTIDNEIDYDKQFKTGELDILFINKNTKLVYEIKKDSLNFKSKNTNNLYDGIVYFKPFYFSANFNYDGLSSKNLFNNNSILFDLVKSEIFNNTNLNINFNVNVKDIVNINELNDLSLKIGIQEGLISFSNSRVMLKDDLEIFLKESILNYDKDQISLIGKIIINIKDKDDFYSSYQVKKLYRKNIKNIKFDFIYNLNQSNITFDNIKIDNLSNSEIDKFVNDFNSNTNKPLNKIVIKNFINNFFRIYAG